jgi:hypothetical protein
MLDTSDTLVGSVTGVGISLRRCRWAKEAAITNRPKKYKKRRLLTADADVAS